MNCESSNMGKIGGNPPIKLKCPTWMENLMKENNLNNAGYISVDNCLKEVILHLWENRIPTLNCCCGHGKENPVIIIPKKENIKNVFNCLSKIDNRDFGIGQWNDDDKLVITFEMHKHINYRGNKWDIIKFINLN